MRTQTQRPMMTEALRKALSERSVSLRDIGAAAGVKHPSMIRFLHGRQSLRLDMADRLARFFGFRVIAPKRKGKARK